MQPQSAQDYKQLLTEVIKKQIVILGPDITLSKARNVKGITVSDDGTVTDVVGSAQEVTQALIDQFVQLSGLIVKKTMEPLLALSQPAQQPQPIPSTSVAPQPMPAIPSVDQQINQTQNVSTLPQQAPITTPIVPPVQPQQPMQNPIISQVSSPTNQTVPTPVSSPSTTSPEPASNPLAA